MDTLHFGISEIHSFGDFMEVIVWGTMITPRNLMIVLAVWLFHHAVVTAFPRGRVRRALNRSRELIYIGGCSALVWTPGLRPEIEAGGFRIALGVALGGLTMLVPWGLGKLAEKMGVDYMKDPRKAK